MKATMIPIPTKEDEMRDVIIDLVFLLENANSVLESNGLTTFGDDLLIPKAKELI